MEKMTSAARVKLSSAQYKTYMNEALSAGVEKKLVISALKAPVQPKHVPHKTEHSAVFDRLSMTRAEYREHVYKKNPKKFPEPQSSQQKKVAIKTVKAFDRLAMSPNEYREAIKTRAAKIEPISSLLPVKRQNSKVTIKGRKPMSPSDRRNFDRLSMTKEERKAALGAKVSNRPVTLTGHFPTKNCLSSDVTEEEAKLDSVKPKKQEPKKQQERRVSVFDRLKLTADEYRAWCKENGETVSLKKSINNSKNQSQSKNQDKQQSQNKSKNQDKQQSKNQRKNYSVS